MDIRITGTVYCVVPTGNTMSELEVREQFMKKLGMRSTTKNDGGEIAERIKNEYPYTVVGMWDLKTALETGAFVTADDVIVVFNYKDDRIKCKSSTSSEVKDFHYKFSDGIISAFVTGKDDSCFGIHAKEISKHRLLYMILREIVEKVEHYLTELNRYKLIVDNNVR